MATFPLKVVSPDGPEFEGMVQQVSLRTIDGDAAILAGHINYCTGIGMGTANIKMEDGAQKTAACIGGMISVMDGSCTLFPTTWEWSDEIDVERAEKAKARAEATLADQKADEIARVGARARLYRALVRLSAAGKNH